MVFRTIASSASNSGLATKPNIAHWTHMLFDDVTGLVRVVVIAIVAYTALVLLLRVAGKRSLAKLNAFDFVVTVALGSILATQLLSKDVALAEGLLGFAMLLGLQWLVTRLSIALPFFRDAVRNKPRLLCRDGKMRPQALKAERVTRSEVEAAIRNAGIGRLEDVAAVVLETDGSMSVIRRCDQPPDLLSGVRE